MSVFSNLAENLWGSIYVPKYVIIFNERLGIMFMAMRIAAIFGVLYVAFGPQDYSPWLGFRKPVGHGVGGWIELGNETAYENADVVHCTEATNYRYIWSSAWVFAPASCQALPQGENFVRHVDNMFIPTFGRDVYTSGQDTYDMEYFSKNPEELKIFILHGYNVQKSAERPAQRTSHKDSTITTIIQHKGTPCVVGGKSEWTAEDARGGIGGTLREWMECSGSSLDDQSDETRSWNPGETSAPHIRLTGAKLRLSFDYQNAMIHGRDHTGIVAFLNVDVIPQWTGWISSENLMSQLCPNSSETCHRHRLSYGVSIDLEASGEFAHVDAAKVLSLFSSAVVLIMLPANIIYWIALYGAGLMSTIYLKSACEDLDLRAHFPSVAARMMLFVNGFRGLTNQQAIDLTDLEPMTRDHMHHKMHEVLHGKFHAEILDHDELSVIITYMLRCLDADGTGEVSMEEFIQACSVREPLDLHEVAMLFDKDRKRSFLEKLLAPSMVDGGGMPRREARVTKRQSRITKTGSTQSSSPFVSPAEDIPERANEVEAAPALVEILEKPSGAKKNSLHIEIPQRTPDTRIVSLGSEADTHVTIGSLEAPPPGARIEKLEAHVDVKSGPRQSGSADTSLEPLIVEIPPEPFEAKSQPFHPGELFRSSDPALGRIETHIGNLEDYIGNLARWKPQSTPDTRSSNLEANVMHVQNGSRQSGSADTYMDRIDEETTRIWMENYGRLRCLFEFIVEQQKELESRLTLELETMMTKQNALEAHLRFESKLNDEKITKIHSEIGSFIMWLRVCVPQAKQWELDAPQSEVPYCATNMHQT